MAETVRTVCDPNCIARPRCGIDAMVEDGRIVSIRPSEYPKQFDIKSRICMMGMSRLEYQYHEDRLLQPLKRVGERGEGRWEPISWDEAIELFVEARNAVSERHGNRAVLYSQYTGAYGLLSRGAANRYAALTGASVMSLLRGGFDYGVIKGLEYTFGFEATSFWTRNGHAFADASNSELVLLWGANPVVTRSVDYSPLNVARRDGTKLICIDPRRTATADISDQWISPRPGTDGALALAMLNRIVAADKIDRKFLMEHTNTPFLVRCDTGALLRAADIRQEGGDEFTVWCDASGAPQALSTAQRPQLRFRGELRLADGTTVPVASAFELLACMASEYTTEVAAEIAGIPADVIANLADDFARARPAAIRAGFGLDHYYFSDLSMRAIAALAVVTGNVGKPGTGVMINAGDKVAPVVGRSFYSPDDLAPHHVFNLMEADAAVVHGTPFEIKMECVSFGNPFNQGKPNSNRVTSEYLGKLDYLVVIDHFMTETAKYADLVLPACTIFERLDMVVDRVIQLQQPAVAPEGQAKSDFDIFRLIAERTGYGDYFAKKPEEYLDEVLRASPDLGGATYADLAAEKVISPFTDNTPHICFADLQFPTPSGRIEIYCEQLLQFGAELPYYKEPVEASPKNALFEQFPLVLLSPHSRTRIHSTFANMRSIRKPDEPIAEVSASDAASRGLQDGDLIEIFNNRGRLVIRCKVNDRVRPGCVVVEEGYWVSEFVDGNLYSLINDNFSPTALTYVHNDVLVEIRKAP